MTGTGLHQADEPLRERVAGELRAAQSAPSVLRHLLGHRSSQFFEEVTLAHLAVMLHDQPTETSDTDLTTKLATVVEWRTAHVLKERGIVDSVASPLLSALGASGKGEARAAAQDVLDAQARFDEAVQRMQLSQELDDQRKCRIDALLNARVLDDLEQVSLRYCGVAVFVSWLAASLAVDRDDVALALDPGQATRFAIMLRAVGLIPEHAAAEMLLLHPGLEPSPDVLATQADEAIALLQLGDDS